MLVRRTPPPPAGSRNAPWGRNHQQKFGGAPSRGAMVSEVRNMATISEKTRQCIDDCGKCHDACLETSMLCLEQGGQYAGPSHLRLLRETAEICQTGAYFLLLGSEFEDEVCDLVAQICTRCAQSCEKLGEQFMQECAAACRKCADSCRTIAGIPRAA